MTADHAAVATVEAAVTAEAIRDALVELVRAFDHHRGARDRGVFSGFTYERLDSALADAARLVPEARAR